MIRGYKQCLNDLDILLFLSLYSVKITASCQNELLELIEKVTTSLNLTVSEMFKIFIKIKRAWM